MPAWRAMIDQHACPLVSITGPDGVGMVMMGSPTVLIDYMMACRMGDIVVEVPGLAMGPMNPIIMGCPTVIIGEIGMGGATGSIGMAMSAAKQSAAEYIQSDNPSQLLGGEIQGSGGAGSGTSSQDQSAGGSQGQSTDSSQPPKLEWIGIRLVYESGEDISGELMKGHTTDGEQHELEVSNGLYFSEIPGGSCKFSFPKFYDDIKNWKPDCDE
jgi:uncharacterized Zn-binding protein involved in type VI secretion